MSEAATRVMGGMVFCTAAALLTSIGGLGIAASPITLTLMYALVRVHPTRVFRGTAITIGGLTALEGGWGLGYLLFGYNSWATIATSLGFGAGAAFLFWWAGRRSDRRAQCSGGGSADAHHSKCSGAGSAGACQRATDRVRGELR